MEKHVGERALREESRGPIVRRRVVHELGSREVRLRGVDVRGSRDATSADHTVAAARASATTAPIARPALVPRRAARRVPFRDSVRSRHVSRRVPFRDAVRSPTHLAASFANAASAASPSRASFSAPFVAANRAGFANAAVRHASAASATARQTDALGAGS